MEQCEQFLAVAQMRVEAQGRSVQEILSEMGFTLRQEAVSV